MNISLKTLTDTVKQMRILLEKAEPTLSGKEYREAMTVYCDIHAEVAFIEEQIKIDVQPVEVEA